MPSGLLPEEDRPGVPIAPPLLFVLPIVALLVIESFVPTTFTQGAFRWNLGAIFFVAGLALSIAGFVTQKRAGTDPIPFNPSTRIVAHGPYRFSRNPDVPRFSLVDAGNCLPCRVRVDAAGCADRPGRDRPPRHYARGTLSRTQVRRRIPQL